MWNGLLLFVFTSMTSSVAVGAVVFILFTLTNSTHNVEFNVFFPRKLFFVYKILEMSQ